MTKQSIKTPEELGIQNKRSFNFYMELHKKWTDWIGIRQNPIPSNSINQQVTLMITNHFFFIGINKAGYLLNKETKRKDFYSLNPTLFRFLTDGYLAYQCLAIRRLVDNGKDTHSLLNFINTLEKSSNHITRESFVCSIDAPYDYALEVDNSDYSRDRHLRFDKISNTKQTDRKRTDKISKEYWKDLRRKICIKEIEDVKEYATSYLAHSLNTKKIQKLSDEEKRNSMDKFEICHKAILDVFTQIVMDFYYTSLYVRPLWTDQIDDFMEQPFVTESIKKQIPEFLKNKKEEYKEAINL